MATGRDRTDDDCSREDCRQWDTCKGYSETGNSQKEERYHVGASEKQRTLEGGTNREGTGQGLERGMACANGLFGHCRRAVDRSAF